MTTIYSLAALVVMLAIAHSTAKPLSSSCPDKGLAVYQVSFYAEWSKSKFPKQYPLYRPPAQWSKVIGRTHNANYNLYSVGDFASLGVKNFVEKGDSSILDDESQGYKGILDVFVAPPIKHGVGNSGAKFFADPQHSKVSMITKIVPSPDWFVGVDSVDLCEGGHWADSLSIDLDPTDAGTDQGYTFTAPNWPSFPRSKIYQITAKKPNHPANSFYYPDLQKLPRIGRMVFKKVDEYGPKVKAADIRDQFEETEEQLEEQETVKEAESEEVEVATEATTTRSPPPAKNRPKHTRKNKHHKKVKHTTEAPVVVPQTEETAPEDANPSANLDCIVSEWSEWSPCSKTCGYGRQSRRRLVDQMNTNDGRPCPLLEESKLCGSMKSCGWKHFSFSNWGTN